MKFENMTIFFCQCFYMIKVVFIKIGKLMIKKVSFGEIPKVNNPWETNNKSENVEKDTNSYSVKLLGLAALGAVALGGIYYMSRGKWGEKSLTELQEVASDISKPVEETVEQVKENILPKLKFNEQSQKIYSEISEKCNAKINIEINDKKSKSLEELAAHYEKEEAVAAEKYFTGVKKYIEKETLSTIYETFENGKLVKKSANYYDLELGKVDKVTNFEPKTGKCVSKEIIGDICDFHGEVVKSGVVFKREVFDDSGKLVEKYEQDNKRFEIWKQLENYDPESGKLTSDYYCSMGNFSVRNFEPDGETLKNSVAISGIKTEDFDEALKFYKKYAPLSDDEIQKLYRQKLANPEDMSNLEFKMLEGNHDLRFDTEPLTSEATVVSEHGAVNGFNTRVRHFVKNGMKDADEIKFLKPRMDKIDKEMANLPPLEKDCVFYRGILDKYISEIINGRVGDIVVPDEGYAYGAFHRELANRFNGGTILVIRTGKGAKVSRCGAHGGEVLYPRGAEYRILSKNKNPNGANIIELEYILPKAE